MILQEGKKYMAVKEYAALKGESVHNVYNKIKRGKLKGEKLAGFQFVLIAD